MRGSRFAPAALETDFGVEDGVARLTVNAVSGECTLEGRIDRIDEWAEGGYLRVIDYKRGGKPLALDEVYHGLSLQLPVYLAAAMKRGPSRAPACTTSAWTRAYWPPRAPTPTRWRMPAGKAFG